MMSNNEGSTTFYNGTQTGPNRQLQIPEQIERLSKSIEILGTHIGLLHDRLRQILRSEPVAKEKTGYVDTKGPEHPANSAPLAEEIYADTLKIERWTSEIKDILDRCEL